MLDHTKIVCVLDRSGSMQAILSDAIGGFNSFVSAQQALGENADISVYLFDEQYETLCEAIPITEAPKLSHENFTPRGTTALLDAVGKTINSTGLTLANTDEPQRPDNVVVVILTDGQENSSREFSQPMIQEMIKRQRDEYQWKFVYLAATAGGMRDGFSMGIPAQDSAQFTADAAGTRQAYSTMSLRVARHRGFKV